MNKPKLPLKLKTPIVSSPTLKLAFAVPKKEIKTKIKNNKLQSNIVKKTSNRSFENYNIILNHFRAKYPDCFSNPIKPLAIGIIKDMLKEKTELKISGIKIRKFCYVYCNTPEYKAVLKSGIPRVDLSGNFTRLVE